MSDESAEVSVRRYNLFVADWLTRARMPTLEIINDRFARYLRAALFQHMRKTIELAPETVELIKHAQFIEGLSDPSFIVLVNLRPLRGTMLVVLDAELVTSVVESRFGGNGRFPAVSGKREFTAIEQKVMRSIVETALAQFALAWKPIEALEPEIVRQESNPQFASVATASEVVIVSSFVVKVDSGGGRLMFCIPYTALEPLRDQLMSGVVADSVDQDRRWYDLLKSGVEQASMPLRVELAQLEMTVGDLLALRPGDVFEIDRPESVIVEANGLPLFRGRWGKHGRKIAVRIEQRLAAPTELQVGAGGREEKRWSK
jgi:flagellar motor switch protein FliM